MATITDRIPALGWDGLTGSLDVRGFAVTPPLLDDAECRRLARLFDGDGFRSTPGTADTAPPRRRVRRCSA